MTLAKSKITAQGQVSVPAEVRKELGVGPGEFIEWDSVDGRVVVRRAGRYTFDDIRKVLFPEGAPKPRTLEELKEGVAQYMRETHGHLVRPARRKHGRR
ncbi:MAG: AbrB/MazE/SpoVT family DNA-binding domain-containing protein [Micropepsaceae bacterium]